MLLDVLYFRIRQLKPPLLETLVNETAAPKVRVSAARLVSVASGIACGLILYVGLAVSQMVALGLNLGVVVGVDSTISSVVNPTSGWVPGLIVALLAALLTTIRRMWFATLSGRIAAFTTVGVLIVVGNILFVDYLRDFGTRGWLNTVLVSGAQSMATYAFVGLVVGSMLVSGQRRDPESM